MTKKLIFNKIKRQDKEKYSVVRISQSALDIVLQIAEMTGQPISKIVSDMVIFSCDFVQIQDEKQEGEENAQDFI